MYDNRLERVCLHYKYKLDSIFDKDSGGRGGGWGDGRGGEERDEVDMIAIRQECC